MQEPLIFCPLYYKIMHLKTKRKFTLLVASNSDFVSANVIQNQHPKYYLPVPYMELNSGLSPSAKQRQNPSSGPPVCVSGFEYLPGPDC